MTDNLEHFGKSSSPSDQISQPKNKVKAGRQVSEKCIIFLKLLTTYRACSSQLTGFFPDLSNLIGFLVIQF